MKKKKWLAMLLTVAMVITMIPATVFAEGSGEWGSDYDDATEFTISNEEELRAFSAMVNEGKDFEDKTVKLANNITMSDENWIPIGGSKSNSSACFAGIFDGQHFVISGLSLKIMGPQDNIALDTTGAGLFGRVSGTVKDVALNELDMCAPSTIGSIASRLLNGAIVSGCSVQGTLSGVEYNGTFRGNYMGGIAGKISSNTTVKDCISNVTITSADYSGGIAGATDTTCENVCIENCVNEAVINGEIGVGGIIGDADGRYKQSVNLLNCTNKGAVNGGSYHVGGIVGTANGTAISGCTNEGSVTGTYDTSIQLGNRGVGGIVGNAVDKVEVTDCRNSGNIVAPQQEWVGGIAGRLHQGSSVNGCTNCGAIQGGDRTGGIVGYADAYVDGYQVADCANTGKVSGANAVGGIVGHTSASNRENANISVTDCTNSGSVSGDSAVGGIVGDHSSSFAIGADDVKTSATVSNCINTGSVPEGAGAIVGNNNTNNNQAGKVESNFWPDSVGLNAVGSGAGSAGESSNEVKNNSSYDKDGNFNSPVVDNEGTEIPNLSGSCEEFFGGHACSDEWTIDVEATCTTPGSKSHHCTRCDAKTDVTEIQATGHSYGEPEWNWSEDGKTCTATFTCENDAAHEERPEVTVTSAVKTPATCTEKGVTTYTATVEFNGVTYSNTKEVTDIPELAHSYKDGKCTVCGAEDPDYIAPVDPSAHVITAGANGVWQIGSSEGLSFTSNAEYADFQKVQVDGKDLAPSNYTVKEGSTIVTLKAEYLGTLSVGKHTLAIVSETGTATTEFTIKAAADSSSQTGDDFNIALYAGLAILAAAGAVGTGIYRRREQ